MDINFFAFLHHSESILKKHLFFFLTPSLIAKKHSSKVLATKNIQVKFGLIDRTEGILKPIEKFYIYKQQVKNEVPDYHYFDAAILILKESVDWGHFVRPACLPINPHLNSHVSDSNLNQVVETVGWGQTTESKSDPYIPTVLQKRTDLKIYGNVQCRTILRTRTNAKTAKSIDK